MGNKIKTLIKTYNKYQKEELYGCKATLKDNNLLLATDGIDDPEVDALDFCVEYQINKELILVAWTDRQEKTQEVFISCGINEMIKYLKEFTNFFIIGINTIKKFTQL